MCQHHMRAFSHYTGLRRGIMMLWLRGVSLVSFTSSVPPQPHRPLAVVMESRRPPVYLATRILSLGAYGYSQPARHVASLEADYAGTDRNLARRLKTGYAGRYRSLTLDLGKRHREQKRNMGYNSFIYFDIPISILNNKTTTTTILSFR